MTKATLNINGKETDVMLTADQVQAIIKASQKITDRVKTFEDACTVLGIDADDITPYPDQDNDFEQAVNAFAKMAKIAEALNEGWEPNWKDTSERKYYPWFEMQSGFGFSHVADDWTHSASLVGSRLVYKTSELAEYAGKQFTSIYKDFYTL